MVKPSQHQQAVLLKPDFLQKDGLKCVSIKLNEIIERGQRLDASYFDIEGKRARQAIENYRGDKVKIKDIISRIWVPPPIKRAFTDNKNIGTPYAMPTDLLCTTVSPEKFVIANKMPNIQDWFVKENWLLVTQSGLVGLPVIATKDIENYVISQNAIRLIFNQEDEAFFVYAFLKSKIGRKILVTNLYGSIITHIEPEHLEEIIIPYPKTDIKQQISEGIKQALNLRNEANRLLKQANELLFNRLELLPLEELKPKYLSNGEARIFSVKISDWQHRLDGSFHLTIVDEIIKQLKKSPAELTTLDDNRISEKIILPGRFKRVYVTEEYGKPFLSGGDILQFDPVQVKYLSIKHHGKRISEQLTLHENMILVTCSGTIGNVVIVPKHLEGWTANQHILRIIPSKDVNPGYIYAFLASSYGRELLRRFTYGSVVDEMDDKQLASVEFPLPNKCIQDEIGNPVLDASRKWTEAYKLEKIIISGIEELITSGSVKSTQTC